VLGRERARDVEIAMLIQRYGLRDLAVRAIELYFSALVGDFQDSVFTTPSSFSNVGALGCNPGMEENTGQGQRQDEGGLDEKRRVIF